MRVEDVHNPGSERARWTVVLETERGTGVRADFRCTASTEPRRYAWRQDIAGSPFERILRESALEIGLEPDGASTRVTLTAAEALRGLSRLGSPMMRGATRKRLDEALAGIDRALVGSDD